MLQENMLQKKLIFLLVHIGPDMSGPRNVLSAHRVGLEKFSLKMSISSALSTAINNDWSLIMVKDRTTVLG